MELENKKNSKLLGLRKLKDKLLNLNPLYNRKIRFSLSERLTWDLTELLNKNDPTNIFSSSVLNLLNNQEAKENFSLDLESFFQSSTPENISRFQKKVEHLQKKNLAVQQEKGYKALFLGVVFVRGYFYNNNKKLCLVNAPLFLLPCDLAKIKNLSLVFGSEKKVNYSLLYYLQKELDLNKGKLADFLGKLEDNKKIENWENYLSFLTQELQNWLSASRVKIKLSPVISSLIEEKNYFPTGSEEEIRELNISPFAKPDLVINDKISNSEKFFKPGEKNPPIKFTGKIIECESKKVQGGKYMGENYYLLLVEHNDNRYINPKKVFIFKNLLRDKSIWQLLTNQESKLGNFYDFYCWNPSPLGFQLSFWEKCENDLPITRKKNQENSTKINYFQPEPFVKLTVSNKPKNYPENQLEVVLNFCLTIDSEPNLSLFRDFEEIIEEYSQGRTINWSKSALALLRGEAGNVVSYPETTDANQSPKPPLYIPFESDPSQTRILKVIFHDFAENTLCIDGPPGTGKSQLICNLLSNALAYQKKVLVVCEKEVALKVIADKLSGIGLNPSFIKISELTQTPRIYQEILSSLENNQQTRVSHYSYFNNEKQIASLEEKQKSNLEKIAKYCQVEDKFRSTRQAPLSEIYLKFDSEQQLSPTLIQLNKGIKNKERLDELKNDLKNYLSRFSKILAKWKPICLQLKNTFLENNLLPFEFNWENKNIFQKIINHLLREVKGEKGETNLLSRILRINLSGECSKNHQSTKLLENKIKDLEELQTEPNYQNFFAFLQIENFTDFWQKCSDKEYLFTIQQFISEEFLIISEINFLLTNFTENTKKNIDFFLQKVLVDQEFNYLENYIEICEQTVYFNWIKEIEEENKEVLAYWNQSELTRIQHEQREISQKKKDLVKGILKNKQKFNLDKLSANQLLMRELNKKRKISPLKKLFPELANYLPIWLTTPEVIASITNRREVIFDFLIFDEASQVLLEKSIPLWARAKKCIVIGDEQQMPPTDIFKSHLENDEEMWEQEEEEKLLNEAEKDINLEIDDLEKNSNLLTYAKKYARSREKLTLLYHYRSKYPELIEFSNQASYNGILQIVSASEIRKKEDTLPIEYHHQNKGCWINNENEVEARYIANLLRTLPKDKEVGIITFNAKQRDLLIDLIGEGNNMSSQKDSKWKDLTDSLRGSQEVHSRFDEFITKIYWLFREKKGKPWGTITEIDFQGFKGFRTDKELRGKRKYRVYGRCDAKFSMKKNQPETETGKISILINQLYLLDKLGMDKVASSYSETESWREQEFTDINFDSLINTIAHELAHAYQFTIHIRKPDDATKSQCESSGEKDRNGNFLYPDKVVEHTQLTVEIEKMTIALSEYQEFKIWWTSKSPPKEEESYRDEKNNDSENKSLSERKNCEYCGKIKSYNCCERSFQGQNKSNNLFIKNLEEVQGDERDIIIFSIGYARNEEGKFYLRFGPLGQKGGEKRLNVAISRAREKVIVVTSLLPSDLNRVTDEDENRNLGPKLFKKYLEYAYYCGKNQPERVQEILKKLPGISNSSLYEKDSGLKDFDSLFEEKVYNELVKNIERYEVHKQVKSVGYHIDLALWDNQIQQYILGVECDGYYWHSQLKDIERDIYRQQLLENKGWKIIRILSRDWCRNKEKEIERVKKEINKVV